MPLKDWGYGFASIKDVYICAACKKRSVWLFATIKIPNTCHVVDVCPNCIECNMYVEYKNKKYYISEIASAEYKRVIKNL